MDLPNVAGIEARLALAEPPAVDLRRLVWGFLRMAPDAAMVGEVRDREPLPQLLASRRGQGLRPETRRSRARP